MARVNVKAVVAISDLLQYLRDMKCATYYLCYNIAQMLGDQIEFHPKFKEYYDLGNVVHPHYGFLEYNDQDNDLSLQVVGQINQFIREIDSSISLNSNYFDDETLNQFQDDATRELARSDPYGTNGYYRIWGRNTRMNILSQILELHPDAVIEIDLS
jgi:glutamine synthetase